MNSSSVSVVLRDVQFSWGRGNLYEEPVSISCQAGELTVLEGPNGSGKTTLLDVLALRRPAPAGATASRTGHSRPADVAYLPQVLKDIDDVTVSDLLRLADAHRQFEAWRGDLDLEFRRLASRRLGTLSGGQKQVLCVAAVASQRTPVSVYDEPFRHLSKTRSDWAQRVIEQQVREGRVVVIADHSMRGAWTVPSNVVRLESRQVARTA